MAVELVVCDGVHTVDVVFCVVGVVGHAVPHLLGDVFNDRLILRVDLYKFLNNTIEMDEQFAILLVGTVPIERPALLLDDILEVPQQRLFRLERDGHVVFDGVEAAQDEVEDGDGDEEFGVELLDDGAEASACEVEVFKALF